MTITIEKLQKQKQKLENDGKSPEMILNYFRREMFKNRRKGKKMESFLYLCFINSIKWIIAKRPLFSGLFLFICKLSLNNYTSNQYCIDNFYEKSKYLRNIQWKLKFGRLFIFYTANIWLFNLIALLYQ